MRKLVLLMALIGLVPQVSVAQDEAVARGQQAFRSCGACHSVGEGAASRMGPELNGVLGGPIAGKPGFSYSKALTQMGADGVIWDHDRLAAFLKKPRDFAPGTKMTFAGLNDADKVNDIIAYLATFSPDHVPADAASAAPVAEPAKN